MPKKLFVPPIGGWVLICPEEIDGKRSEDHDWYIAWHEPFGRKKEALAFASRNRWPKPYRAVRGALSVAP